MNPIRKLMDVMDGDDSDKSFAAMTILAAVALGSFAALLVFALTIYPPSAALVIVAPIVALYIWTTT
jgi:fatty acid desaturase